MTIFLSLGEIVERSVAIAVRSIVRVKPGRSIERGAVTKTMVTELEASEVLLENEDRFYVEFQVEADDGDFFSKTEQNEPVVFQHNKELTVDGSVEIIDEGAEYPEGNVLNYLSTLQGRATEVSGGGRLVQLPSRAALLYTIS